MKITIVGAGIGGLTTAIALEQKGFEVAIFEAAPAIQEVGAGIVLAFNAMQVYRHLGLAESIERAGFAATQMKITDAALQPISTINLLPFCKKYGLPAVAIHRGVLQQALLGRVEGPIHLNKRLQFIDEKEGGLLLQFEDGSQHHTNLLIGADGIHSQVRQKVCPKARLRNAHQPCWRGITHFGLPETYRGQLIELWGKGRRFGFTNIDNERVYWYALANESIHASTDKLGQVFRDFHPLVSQLILSTDKLHIHHADLMDIEPINRWHTANICLIGDAAHATTPNMGQGACQAIEDAWVLSKCLLENEPSIAFQQFQQKRRPKATKVVNMSWRIGTLAHWQNGLSVRLRNMMMRSIPASIASKQNEWVYELIE